MVNHCTRTSSLQGVFLLPTRAIALAIMITVLGGCTAVPRGGPSNSAIVASAETFNQGNENAYVYDVVDVTSDTVRSITNYHSTVFARSFGSPGAPGSSVIGVGDELTITIFEASTEGLFSTTDNKSTTIQVIVQPNGTASIPYVGNIRFAGRTIQSARESLLSALRGKAIEPDILVNLTSNASRQVTVLGEVRNSAQVPIGLVGSRLLEVIALAGGPSRAPYDTKVTIVRGNKRATTRLTNVVEHASENTFVRPMDQIFLEYDPSRFFVLGASGSKGRIAFDAPNVSLIEAIALAGGKDSTVSDPRGVFIFRYENKPTVKDLLGHDRYNERFLLGHWSDTEDKYPMVYRLDTTHPSSYLVGQEFQVHSGDVLYLAEHPATEFDRFLRLLGLTLGTVITARDLE